MKMLTKSELQKKIKIYFNLIRLDRPTGLLLFMLPSVFGVLMASHFEHNYIILLKFIIGAFLMRSAGCIINDFVDKDIDIKVERTKKRAITSGLISKKEALQVLGVLLFLALVILLTMKLKTIIVGIFTLIPVCLYPYMKRITFFPQVFLGFTFNLGVILAFIEAKGYVGLNGFLIYLALSLWTISYDTIYGYLDKKDDMKIGVKSTSIFLDKNFYIYMEFFNTIITLLLVIAGLQIQAGMVYFLMLGASYLVFMWQKNRLDINETKTCELIFNSNIFVVILLMIGALNA